MQGHYFSKVNLFALYTCRAALGHCHKKNPVTESFNYSRYPNERKVGINIRSGIDDTGSIFPMKAASVLKLNVPTGSIVECVSYSQN